MTNHQTNTVRSNKTAFTAHRRDVVKATAGVGLAAIAMTGGNRSANTPLAHAQELDGTRARSWSEAESIDTSIKLEGDGWVTLQTEFPFWSLGFGWDAEVGTWPVVEYAISYDGREWDDGYAMDAHNDGGPAAADDRVHTFLHFTDGHQYVRYRTVDGEGNLVILDRFIVTYIDPTDGPWSPDRGRTLMRTTAVNADTRIPPTIISRVQWGANESLRFNGAGELWPPEYAPVEHAIVHHAEASYGSDGYLAVRSIYYYHCVTQGWGDIGYNYVVDTNGNIFEGRVGGANVIGGHAFQYAIGSSGICVMGNFTWADPPMVSKVALANIVAYVVRDLDPLGFKTFHQVLDLPTIAGHRDVIATTCPGEGLYDDLPWIRTTVANILNSGALESHMPGGIVPGDWVRIQTEDESALNMRAQPGLGQLVIDAIPHGIRVEVDRGPLTDSDHNWYLVKYNNKSGWVPADYLLVDPPTVYDMVGYEFGRNIRFNGAVILRSSPSANAGSMGTENSTWAFLQAGPYWAGGTSWFQVHTENGRSGWVHIDQFTVETPTSPPSAYAIGRQVQLVRYAAIRVRPGISQTIGASLGAGTRFTISLEPVGATGTEWYGVFGGTGVGSGWVDARDIEALPEPVSAVGQRYRVTESMNFRSGAGTGYGTIGTLNRGDTGTVIGGPQNANGYTWWRLQTDRGTQGWAAGSWLVAIGGTPVEPTPDPDPDPTPTDPPPSTGGKFNIGDTARVIESLNMRSGAGTWNGVVAVLPVGTTSSVLDGPTSASGYTWWKIQTNRGTGWAVENWLDRQATAPPPDPTPTPGPGSDPDPTPTPTPTDPPPPTGGKFEISEGVRVTEGLNMRSGAGTGYGVIVVLPANTTGTVLEGPVSAGGYTWWKLQTTRGTGWVVENWIVSQGGSGTPNPPTTGGKFAIGNTVRVTETLNMRSGAGTWNGVVAVLAAGVTGTVLDGPQSANGYTWWRIQTNSGTGWAAQDWLTK